LRGLLALLHRGTPAIPQHGEELPGDPVRRRAASSRPTSARRASSFAYAASFESECCMYSLEN
jgi:hypothetical protein